MTFIGQMFEEEKQEAIRKTTEEVTREVTREVTKEVTENKVLISLNRKKCQRVTTALLQIRLLTKPLILFYIP